MPKIKKIVFFIITMFIITKVYAQDTISNYCIDATLDQNGNLNVQEYFVLDGEYNGYERIIEYENSQAWDFDPSLEYYGGSKLHNADDIVLKEIAAINPPSGCDFNNLQKDPFVQNISAQKGDYGYYQVDYTSGGYKFRIFMPSHLKKAFYIKYQLTNMAISHNDVGEIGWNIFSDAQKEYIKKFQVVLNVPNNQNLRVWAHGPLDGQVTKDGETKLIATISNLPDGTPIDIRATFDKEIINNSPKQTHIDALDKIIAYEENSANQANYERTQNENYMFAAFKEELAFCQAYPNRTCYNSVLNGYNLLSDENKEVYQEFVEELHQNVIIAEEKEALNYIQTAKNLKSYKSYSEALSYIKKLEDTENKKVYLSVLEEVKKEIKEQEKINTSNNIFIAILYTGLAVLVLVIYIIIHKKEPSSTFNQDYLREIPDKLSPTAVSYLLNNSVTKESISAELINLINIGAVKSEKSKNGKYSFIKNKTYKGTLTPKQNKVLSLFGINDQFYTSLDSFNKSSSKHYKTFINVWNDIVDYTLKEIDESQVIVRKLYKEEDNKSSYNKKNLKTIRTIIGVIAYIACISIAFLPIGLIFLVVFILLPEDKKIVLENSAKEPLYKKIYYLFYNSLAIYLFIVMFTYVFENHYYYSAVFFYIIAITFSFTIPRVIKKFEKKTQKGVDSTKKWLALKKFFNNFGRLYEKGVPDLPLWKEYLTYATVLGCADKLKKQMDFEIQKYELSDKILNNYDTLSIITYSTIISNNIQSARRSALSSQRQHLHPTSSSGSSSSSSSWSSGSGGGGGFSSGGGSFGGGGGGGRF